MLESNIDLVQITKESKDRHFIKTIYTLLPEAFETVELFRLSEIYAQRYGSFYYVNVDSTSYTEEIIGMLCSS